MSVVLDGWVKPRLDPVLDRLARKLAATGVGADTVTVVACAVGLAATGAIAFGYLWSGLALLLISRLGDGLDGAVARLEGKTDYGGFLDIVLDFVFYGAIPLGFVLLDPAANAVAGAVLIFTFYINGASFLAFAVMAERRGLSSDARGEKSIFFTTGLAEATETILLFVAFCLLPASFATLSYVFAALTAYTAVSRIVLARRSF